MRIIDADILERSLTEIDEHINMDIFTNEVRELIDNTPTVEAISKADYENRLKSDMTAMLEKLKYELYCAFCHEIHGKEDCPCTNQTTSCLATFRVCDADRAIGRVIQDKIEQLKRDKR